MKIMFVWLAHWIGWKTVYHVSWINPLSVGYKSGDMILTVRPWITKDNWHNTREVIAEVNELEPASITVISVIKL